MSFKVENSTDTEPGTFADYMETPLVAHPRGPGLINVAQSPFASPEERKRAGLRERLRVWNDYIVRENNFLPVFTLLMVYTLLGALWWGLFRYLVADDDQPLHSDLNVRRFVLYNALHGGLGLGATCGLLGFRFKIAVGGPALHFLTPGTLSSPLLPNLVRFVQKVPARRSPCAVVCYVALVFALVHALRARVVGCAGLVAVYITLAAATIFDFSIFQSIRGEHYGYMIICLAFPDWQNGCQCVQVALWLWAALSKCGPWFAPIPAFLMKDSLFTMCMPRGFHAKLFTKDYPQDLNASRLAEIVARLATLMELLFPVLCCAPMAALRMTGACGMVAYHCFIIASLPFASVCEWNYFSIAMTYYLFCLNTFSLPTSPLLVAFLSMVLLFVPALGQLFPNFVPFLTAYRPYAGNWRFSWYVLHKNALSKHQRLKTWESPFAGENGVWFYGLLGKFGAQGKATMVEFEDYMTALVISWPSYRPIISILEKLCEDNGWDIDDLMYSFSEPYQNQVFGWSLGTGWIAARECTREAFNSICEFTSKEMYFVQFEPMKPWPQDELQVQYRCFDVTKGPRESQIHGVVSYKELARSQPAGLVLQPHQMLTGESLQGIFNSTYY